MSVPSLPIFSADELEDIKLGEAEELQQEKDSDELAFEDQLP